MDWNMTQAKQHFPEVVKQAALEPQFIFESNRPVAAVIAASDLAAYRAWKTGAAAAASLGDEFAELRRIMQEEHIDCELEAPARIDRENAFMQISSAPDTSL